MMSDDLIKRSDAIKAVNRAKAEGMVECPTYYLGVVPSADSSQEWTPCSERLPSDYNNYLVIDGDGEMAVGYYRADAHAWDNGHFGWLERDNDDEQPARLGRVEAWMSLPEPYKESE